MKLNRIKTLIYSLVLVLFLVSLVGCSQPTNSDSKDSISLEEDIQEEFQANAKFIGESFINKVNKNEEVYHLQSPSYRYDEETNTLHCEALINEVMLIGYAFGDVLSDEYLDRKENWKREISLLAEFPNTQLEALGQSTTKVMFTIYTTTDKFYLRAINGVIKDEASFDIFGFGCTEEEFKAGADEFCIPLK